MIVLKVKIIEFKRALFLCFVFCILTACGSGSSDSDNSENAIDDASSLVGVYQGSETVRLIRESNGVQEGFRSNTVTIVVNDTGILSLSTSGGNSGQAQITNGQTFQLRADARTQFNGQCGSGTVFIDGNVSSSSIIASYSSQDLVCGGDAFRVEGNLDVRR